MTYVDCVLASANGENGFGLEEVRQQDAAGERMDSHAFLQQLSGLYNAIEVE